MQIKVKCSCGEDRCSEWAVVEVQGVVEAQPSFQDRLQNLEIGLLCRPSSQESYTFTVGYHELTGTKVNLKKPIVVLKKIKFEDEVKEGEGSSNSKRVELDVIGVIHHKILFKTRPRALISTKVIEASYDAPKDIRWGNMRITWVDVGSASAEPQQSGKERITAPSSMALN